MKLRIPKTLFALGLLGFGLGACDVLISNADRLARAEQALEAGRLEAAVSDARAVLKKDETNAGAWLLMARTGLKYGNADSALQDLERATRHGAAPAAVSALRDEAMLLAGRYRELLESELPPDVPDTPAHQVAIATSLAALSRYDEARAMLDKVLAEDPRHMPARLLDIRIQRATGHSSGARAALEALLQDEPNFAQALMLQGQQEMLNGDYPAAVAAFERATGHSVQLNLPEQAQLLGALIEAQLAAGDRSGAAASVAKLKSLAPRWPTTDLLAARLALEQGDATTAVSTLQSLLARDPAQTSARALLGAALLEQGAVEQARSQLTRVLADQPENVPARKLMARLYMEQGDSRAAERVLTEIPTGAAPDPTVDWMRSAILSMSGQSTEALSVLEQAARADPENVPLQLDLARAYLSVGRKAESARVLAAVPVGKTGLVGRQLAVLNRVIGVSDAEAVSALLALADEQPDDFLQRAVIGQTLLQLDHPGPAREQFIAALGSDARLSLARQGLAAVALRQGDLDEAERQLHQVLELEPANERAHLGLAAIASRRDNRSLARQWLERGISAVPGTVDIRLALAELSFQEQKPDVAEELVAQVLGLSGNKSQAHTAIGMLQQRAGRPEKAVAAFEVAYQQRPAAHLAIRLYEARQQAGHERPDAVLRQWLQGHPEDLPARVTLASHLLATGDLTAAKGEYERLVERAPSPALLNNLAWVYQSIGDSRAESIARRAYEMAPGHTSIADTYGWILLEKGRVSEALPLLEKAARALPENKDVQDHYRRARELAGGNK